MALDFTILREEFPDSKNREEFAKIELGKYLQSEEKVRVFKQMRDSLVKDFLNASYPDILRKACRCALRWNMETEYAVKVTDGVVT